MWGENLLIYEKKVNLKLILEQATKAQRALDWGG
jgi:hypothetical protein